MSPLAEPLQFDDPSTSYLSSTSGSTIVKRLAWYDLAPETRKGYKAARESYESFCMLMRLASWPATNQTLEEWSAHRIFGSNLPKQGQIKPDTVVSYLSGLRSHHVDHHLPLDVFDNPRLARIIKGGRRLFPSVKSKRLPITKDILKKITAQPIMSVDDYNIDTAFKIAWAGFLRLGEIIYTSAELKKANFVNTHATRSDVSFAEGNQYAVLRLKRSKTEIEHSGVQIILTATGENTCPVAALRQLFLIDSQPSNAPLFRLNSGSFSRQGVVAALKKKLIQTGIKETEFSGHSFRKEAAQYAADQGMLDENIQRLGRWTSNVFRLYFKTSPATLFNLNLSFQKSIPLAVLRVKVESTSGKSAIDPLRPHGDSLHLFQSTTHTSLGTSPSFGQTGQQSQA